MSVRTWLDDSVRTLSRPAGVNLDNGDWPYHPMSLADGYCGLAVLFARLSDESPELRETAHAHLTAAARTRRPTTESLFDGLPSLGFAARSIARADGDYRDTLARIDPHVLRLAESALDGEEARLLAREPGAAMACYDVTSGLSGVGRYLLACGAEARPVLERVLGYLVRLTDPVRVRGHRVPGWWTSDPSLLADPVAHPDGHLNLGMAHGVAGPLALLALCHGQGVVVEGHGEAIRRIATWLLSRRGTDEHGPYWPALVPLEHEVAGAVDRMPPSRIAWCYGPPGVARAVQLASAALDEPAWAEKAKTTLRAAFRRPQDQWGIKDASLCHGSAGVLHATALVLGRDADVLPALCDHLLAQRDRHTVITVPPNRPGFLDGSAGTLLALHDYLTPAPSTASLPWNAALVLG
ncbi:lanthionine synthetase C family protein [Umezawaea endophytica]|uniref:Lanthionine synthetase C family protein n=1 Tax=Umezawaea endophytica TaxID=1654476 RepID=A0A9X3A1H3_9PSEU|nr:lanthionine synthetase C family protein [Umezawaea endophytica]MCS7479669.1 lanthionine synthetase C family protein [Umezawaea endophytica]